MDNQKLNIMSTTQLKTLFFQVKGQALSLFDKIVINLRIFLYNLLKYIFEYIATLFGFPDIPGMPSNLMDYDEGLGRQVYGMSEIEQYISRLPKLQVPPRQPEINSFSDIFLGAPVKPFQTFRHYFEGSDIPGVGYYSFYIDNFRNYIFLPDFLSEFLQTRCNFYFDYGLPEDLKVLIFMIGHFYIQLINLRVCISWFTLFNPYSFPLRILTGLTERLEELSSQYAPSIGGLAIGMSVYMALVGNLLDTLNYIVFTMPYLPSEGIISFRTENDTLIQTLVFTDIPYLWVKYPIPDPLRDFWFFERPEILKYMEATYSDLGINFRPDENVPDRTILNLIQDIIFNILTFILILLGKLITWVLQNYPDWKKFFGDFTGFW